MKNNRILKNLLNSWSLIDYFILTAVFGMFIPTFARLIDYGWRNADYTHAYFILPISLFIIWTKRKELVLAPDWHFTGTIPFIFGVLAYIYSAINAFMFLEATSFVLVIWGVFRLRLTKKSFAQILFPLSYLIFLIPPPSIVIDMLTFPLKQIAAKGSHFILGLVNLPVELYGVILKVGDHELLIADACSGFRSIVTILALGAVYVYFQDMSKIKKWIVFISVVPIALVANIVRICLTGLIAYKWGPEKAEGFFHEFSGLVLFFITVMCLMGIARLVSRVRRAESND